MGLLTMGMGSLVKKGVSSVTGKGKSSTSDWQGPKQSKSFGSKVGGALKNVGKAYVKSKSATTPQSNKFTFGSKKKKTTSVDDEADSTSF